MASKTTELRAHERFAVAFFGLFVASLGGVVLAIIGTIIVAAALGLVELAMALYYRSQKERLPPMTAR